MKRYLPLFVILALTMLAATAKQLDGGVLGGILWGSWMHDFMGFFLLVFAMLKLFDIDGFATGFARYDFLASRSRLYGRLFPFIELALGLAYLAHWQPTITYIVTIIVFGFSTLGVVVALKKGLNVNCACLGTTLNVPLSTVAIVEDLGMVIMAVAMLILP
ncbi:MAG: MauE/DoxX family redox-associated membrane protein [Verrucomicrobiota bacterium]